MKKRNKIKQKVIDRNGITLIALVITIIVLLVLAGVTIASITGENRILKKATDAKSVTEKAKLVEEVQTEILSKQAENKIGDFDSTDESSDKLKYQRTEWYVEDNNGTKASKDELTLTNSDVTYSNDDIKYGITADVSKEIVAQIKAEKESVKKYGGYYIGRYETGKNANSAVIKPNEEEYTEITWSQAYSLAKGIGGGTGATTYLCSSYAWDTAINFIESNGAKDYATKITDFNGNWYNQQVVKDGEIIRTANEVQRLKTGQTTAWGNIYDIGGNVGEFTTELNPGTLKTLILRGGSYLR